MGMGMGRGRLKVGRLGASDTCEAAAGCGEDTYISMVLLDVVVVTYLLVVNDTRIATVIRPATQPTLHSPS